MTTPPKSDLTTRCVIALLVGLGAVGLQWVIVPLVGFRTPFLFILIALGAAAFYLGWRPALIILGLGLANASLQSVPIGSLAVASVQDRNAIVIFFVASIGLVVIGEKFRRLFTQSERNLNDVEQLHALSLQLASTPTLDAQLHLVLTSLSRLHGAQHGLVSLFDNGSSGLRIVASYTLSALALKTIEALHGEKTPCARSCAERRRVIVEALDSDERFVDYRKLAEQEGFHSVHSTPILTGAGECLGALSVIFDRPHVPDQREQRLAEICARKVAIHVERARAQALAVEGDRRLRRVVEASAIPFSVLAPVQDSSGTIIDFTWDYLNPSAAKVIGKPADHLIGKRVSEELPGTWDEPGMFERYVAVLLRDESHEFEIHNTKNGIEGWFQVVAYKLDGKVAVWFADVSQRKRQENELRDADRRKDEFLATLAHELRNPLAPIRQVALLSKKPTLTPAQREWCNDVVERQVQHMSLLLDDLLDVSRITRGALQLRKRPTTLGALVDSAVETTRPFVESKKHSFQVDITGRDTQVDVDPIRMSQVVSNLVNNAAKYTPTGGEIRLQANVTNGCLALEVSDNGVGIAQSDLSVVFRMFSQIRSSQEYAEGGLGIGLALTKGLVELHGGKIKVESAGLGKGSIFSISIPDVVREEKLEANESKQTPRPILSRRILVADDNRDAAESLAMLLRTDGHTVAVAYDGVQAVKAFEELNPDVILLDIGMPKMSGFEVGKRIREQGSTALLIAITGWGQTMDRAKSAAAGFDHHMTKPVNYNELTGQLAPMRLRQRGRYAAGADASS